MKIGGYKAVIAYEQIIGCGTRIKEEYGNLYVTRAARNLSELLNRVAYQGASFELKRGGKSIARLVPAGPAKRVKVSDLNGLFARIPRLDEDGDAFAKEIDNIRRDLSPEKDPWD